MRWVYSDDAESFPADNRRDTEEAAIAAGREEFGQDSFYVGRCADVGVPLPFSWDTVVEMADEAMNDDFSFDSSAFEAATSEQLEELEKQLNDVFYAWVRRHHIDQDWFGVIDVRRIDAPPAEARS
jgi:hypothetical protein